MLQKNHKLRRNLKSLVHIGHQLFALRFILDLGVRRGVDTAKREDVRPIPMYLSDCLLPAAAS